MTRYLLFFIFFPVFLFSNTYFTVGATFVYEGKTYRIDRSSDGLCATGGTVLTSPILLYGNLFQGPTDINNGCDVRYYHVYAELQTTLISDTPCDAASTGLCYQNLCDDSIDIDGINYINNGIQDIETCTSNPDGTDTGYIWRDALDCYAPTGACMQENNCTAPVGYSNLTNATTAASCDVQIINSGLPTNTNMIIVEAIWQECDTKCYVKAVDIDCASQIPYVLQLQEGETIYSTDLTLAQCVEYANTQNMDARYETYKTQEAPGFSCQDLKFCIVKDRPHTCQGIDTPLPGIVSGETYFTVNTAQECVDYGLTNSLPVRTEHFDDKDNSGRFCYDVNYCVVLPYVDNNGSTGGNPGTDTNDTTTTPDNTGTHGGTGATSIDLNGTNDRLDIIDGHIKDGNQVNRQGFDRNHDDLNRLSQDIKDGADLINRGLNGLSHGIGSVLDHIKNGEINSTGTQFDDSGIIEANNNTTNSIDNLLDYLRGDGNGTSDMNLSDLNLADLNLSQLYDAVSSLNDQLDTNLTKEELIQKIEDEITEQMQDFKDKSQDAITSVFDETFANLFNPFEPLITTGSNLSNFKKIELPIVVSSVGYSGALSFASTDVFGTSGSPLSLFYEIMRVVLAFIAVIAGFMYLIEEVNNG